MDIFLFSDIKLQSRNINMNSFGDDYVSFVPMHLTFSPDGRFFIVSTGIFKKQYIFVHYIYAYCYI